MAGGKEEQEREAMIIGGKKFDTVNQKYIMGILNVTPDSFSDGGKFNSMDQALRHAEEMIRDGADIIDVGGESTRPGYTKISDEEEIERTAPIIRALKAHFDVPVSIDTYKSGVARACAEAGADLINDIWGLQYDAQMAGVIAQYDLPCCLMHNRTNTEYLNYMEDVLADLRHSLDLAEAAGILKENIILDPGVGFAKNYEQNLIIIHELEKLTALPYPVLLGTSRKSVIGLTLQIPAPERVNGTVATTVIGAMKGCAFFRVHDVLANKQALLMTEAIRKASL